MVVTMARLAQLRAHNLIGARLLAIGVHAIFSHAVSSVNTNGFFSLPLVKNHEY